MTNYPKIFSSGVALTLYINRDRIASYNCYMRVFSRAWTQQLNQRAADSAIGRWFQLDPKAHNISDDSFALADSSEPESRLKPRKGARFLTEIHAGLTIFAAMAYIITVNSKILSATGGTCVCNGTPDDPLCEKDNDYLLCAQVIQRDLITATSAIACISSFLMGLLANLPIALAPGLGLNAYFAYQVVGFHGSGRVSYGMALTAVFFEGIIFMALALFGLRAWLARMVPRSLKAATSTGIGLYLTLIGLGSSNGIGAIGPNTATMIGLGGCPAEYIDPVTKACKSHVLQSGTMWMGIFLGGIFVALMLIYRVKGAFLIGILLVAISSWPRNSSLTQFPHDSLGDANFDFFKQVMTFHPIQKTLNVLEWKFNSGDFWIALATFLYVDIMDCTGTLYAMATFAGLVHPDTQDFDRSTAAYTVDALSITIGSLFGCSSVTAFIESGAGIEAGGKTGITAITTALCFFLSLFFSPIFASIPPWASGGTLIIVGSMMMRSALDINFKYYGDSIPAFVTLALTPFSFSIAYGLIAGIITYIVINGSVAFVSWVSKGRIVPYNIKDREPSVSLSKDSLIPAWFVMAKKLNYRAWRKSTIMKSNVDSEVSSLQ